MNYYENKKHMEWLNDQREKFMQTSAYKESKAGQLNDPQAILFLSDIGNELCYPTDETFLKAVQPFKEWQEQNCSVSEEYIYNEWVKAQKEAFKSTPEYKLSGLYSLLQTDAFDSGNLPHGDGVEVHENGDIELCSGEIFKQEVVPWKDFLKEVSHNMEAAEEPEMEAAEEPEMEI